MGDAAGSSAKYTVEILVRLTGVPFIRTGLTGDGLKALVPSTGSPDRDLRRLDILVSVSGDPIVNFVVALTLTVTSSVSALFFRTEDILLALAFFLAEFRLDLANFDKFWDTFWGTFWYSSSSSSSEGPQLPLQAAKTSLGATRGSARAKRLIERLTLWGPTAPPGGSVGLELRLKAPES